jgi:hypothetical protein
MTYDVRTLVTIWYKVSHTGLEQVLACSIYED